MKEVEIVHDIDNRKFEYSENGESAHLLYAQDTPGVWRLTHTLVPKSMGGKGIASGLAKKALMHCRNHGISIIAECTFITTYIKRNPEWEDIVLKY